MTGPTVESIALFNPGAISGAASAPLATRSNHTSDRSTPRSRGFSLANLQPIAQRRRCSLSAGRIRRRVDIPADEGSPAEIDSQADHALAESRGILMSGDFTSTVGRVRPSHGAGLQWRLNAKCAKLRVAHVATPAAGQNGDRPSGTWAVINLTSSSRFICSLGSEEPSSKMTRFANRLHKQMR